MSTMETNRFTWIAFAYSSITPHHHTHTLDGEEYSKFWHSWLAQISTSSKGQEPHDVEPFPVFPQGRRRSCPQSWFWEDRFLGKWTFRALSDSAAPGAQTRVPVPLSATEGSVVDQTITDSTTPQIQNWVYECKGQEMQCCDKTPHPTTVEHRTLKDTSLEGRGEEERKSMGEWGAGAVDVPIYGQMHSM